MKTGNLFAGVPDTLEDEQFTDLINAGAVRITRIVSTGQATDWMVQEDDEWVMVVAGSATLEFSGHGQAVDMVRGDWCHIPAGERNRVAATDTNQPTVWLAVHFPGTD